MILRPVHQHQYSVQRHSPIKHEISIIRVHRNVISIQIDMCQVKSSHHTSSFQYFPRLMTPRSVPLENRVCVISKKYVISNTVFVADFTNSIKNIFPFRIRYYLTIMSYISFLISPVKKEIPSSRECIDDHDPITLIVLIYEKSLIHSLPLSSLYFCSTWKIKYSIITLDIPV